jgi:hypothetical protein
MKAHYTQVQQTTYAFTNKSGIEHTLYLEHPRYHKEWKLFDTPDPKEITENYWRFQFTLPAKTTAQFAVRQQRTLHQDYSISDIDDRRLALWLEERYLDAKTEGVLRQVIELRQEVATAEAKYQRREKERTAIHNEQQRIRENLQALGDRPSEKDLRERFVRALNSQEDRLETIDQEMKEQSVARDRCREQLNALLAKLEYEAAV